MPNITRTVGDVEGDGGSSLVEATKPWDLGTMVSSSSRGKVFV